MMQCDQLRLHVGSGAHLLGAPNQNADLTASDLAEQFLFLCFGSCGVNEGDFLLRDALCYELLFQIVVDIE